MVTFLARIRKEYYHGLKYQKMVSLLLEAGVQVGRCQ
jgi:hypothetical protein